MLGDSGRRSQTGEEQIRAEAERNDRAKRLEGISRYARVMRYIFEAELAFANN